MDKIRKKKRVLVILAVLLVLLLALAAAMGHAPRSQNTPTQGRTESGTEEPATTTGEVPEQTLPEETGVTFPLLLEDGRLELRSVFPGDGLNPDCGGQTAAGVAALTVVNVSEAYLEEADITLETAAGKTLRFRVTHLPAGASAVAFSLDNDTLDGEDQITRTGAETRFGEVRQLLGTQVAAQAMGTSITLTNLTQVDLENLTVVCRTPLGEEYFGGLAVCCQVERLPAGGTVELQATECILGFAEVVSIVCP